MLYQIQSPSFVAGFETGKLVGIITQIAPRIRYMKTWSLPEIEKHCRAQGWKLICLR
jgi:hypothetical protein